MEEWFSEYDADAEDDVGRGLYCLYWVKLEIKTPTNMLTRLVNIFISFQIFLPGSTIAGSLISGTFFNLSNAMGIFKF